MRGVLPGVAAGLLLLAGARAGTITFEVQNFASPQRAEIEAAIKGAGAQWAQYFDHSGNLEVQVLLVPDADIFLGRSTAQYQIGTAAGIRIFQPAAAYELSTGIDNNAGTADIRFTIGTDLLPQLWFDPDPIARTAPVPEGKIDAVSLFMREYAHAFASFGWRDVSSGALPAPGDYQSTFDRHVTMSGGVPYFSGPTAVAAYGGPVPLRAGELFNLGNPGGPGAELMDSLMGSGTLQTGVRYSIGALELAIASDTGLQTLPIPEPGAVALVGLGLVAVLWRKRRLG